MFNSAFLYAPYLTPDEKMKVQAEMVKKGYAYTGKPLQNQFDKISFVRAVERINSNLFSVKTKW